MDNEIILVRDRREGDWFWIEKAVWLVKELTASDKIVYAVLAMHANCFTQECYPSFNRIAELSGLSRRQVPNSIKRLEGSKLINIHRVEGKNNVYALLNATSAKNAPEQKSGEGEGKIDTGGGQNSTPNNNNITRIINNKEIFKKNYQQAGSNPLYRTWAMDTKLEKQFPKFEDYVDFS